MLFFRKLYLETNLPSVIVASEDVDLNLRISQPDLHNLKRDGNSSGTNFCHGSFESMQMGNTQVDDDPLCFFIMFGFVGIFKHMKLFFVEPIPKIFSPNSNPLLTGFNSSSLLLNNQCSCSIIMIMPLRSRTLNKNHNVNC